MTALAALTSAYALLALLAAPLIVRPIRDVASGATGRDLIPTLAGTGAFELVWALSSRSGWGSAPYAAEPPLSRCPRRVLPRGCQYGVGRWRVGPVPARRGSVMEIEVVVIGAGQAGLATSHELSERGVEHVVLEAERPGFSWLGRWDSFTLVTPNHSIRLPGGALRGRRPHGYLPRAEIEEHIRTYAAGLAAEVRSGTRVDRLGPPRAGGFLLDTADGPSRLGRWSWRRAPTSGRTTPLP